MNGPDAFHILLEWIIYREGTWPMHTGLDAIHGVDRLALLVVYRIICTEARNRIDCLPIWRCLCDNVLQTTWESSKESKRKSLFHELSRLYQLKNNVLECVATGQDRGWSTSSLMQGWELERLAHDHADLIRSAHSDQALPCKEGTGTNRRLPAVSRMVMLPGGSGHEIWDDGEFPLLQAVFRGDAEHVQELLRKGASVTMQTIQTGLTALMPTVYREHSHLLGLLAAWGSDIECRDAKGYTVLHYAVKRDQRRELNLCIDLLWRKVPVDMWKELVIFACARRASACLSLLLDRAPVTNTKRFLDRVARDIIVLPRDLYPPPVEERRTLASVYNILGLQKDAAIGTAAQPQDCVRVFDVSDEAALPALDLSLTQQLKEFALIRKFSAKFCSTDRFHTVGPSGPSHLTFVLHCCRELGKKSVTCIDCYKLARAGFGETWEPLLQAATDSTPRDSWLHFDGLEALYLDFPHPERDNIPLDMIINNCNSISRGISIGVDNESYLRRRTCSFGGFMARIEGESENVFVRIGAAKQPSFLSATS